MAKIGSDLKICQSGVSANQGIKLKVISLGRIIR